MTATVEFSKTKKVEPEDLITFSQEYTDHIPTLLNFLENNSSGIKLLFFRIKPNGCFVQNKVYGTVKDLNLEKGTFFFESSTDLDGGLSDEPITTFVRTDNVLGILPALQDFEQNPYKNSETEITNQYFKSLSEMKNLLRECIGKVCAVTLFFRYNNDKQNEIFRNGFYSIKLNKVLEVNNSNIQYINVATSAWVSENESFQDKLPETRTRTFTSSTNFLYKVSVIFDSQHPEDPYDHNE